MHLYYTFTHTRHRDHRIVLLKFYVMIVQQIEFNDNDNGDRTRTHTIQYTHTLNTCTHLFGA